MKFFPLVLVFAIATALGRIVVTPRLTNIPSVEGAYEALAHLFVGFLILVPFYDRDQELGPSKMYGWIGWALALWELGWFLFQKAHA
jgi:hypothetical protein